MKLLSRHSSKSHDCVEMICETVHDVFHIYNLVRVGDIVRSSAYRRISGNYRSHCEYVIRVSEITAFDQRTGQLSLKGMLCEPNKYCHYGELHTIFLETGQKFELRKEHWDKLDLRRLDESLGINRHPDVAILLAHTGLANLCLVSSSVTSWKTPVHVVVPHKRKDFIAVHEMRMEKFISMTVNLFLKHVDMKAVKRVIIAADYALRDKIYNALLAAGGQLACNAVMDHKWKIIRAQASSGFRHSLAEVLSDKTVKEALKDCQFQNEFEAIDQFYEMMHMNEYRAVFGFTHVYFFSDHIKTLLISDELIRLSTPELRSRIIHTIESVEQMGGTVTVISAMHVGGEKLRPLRHIAAILHYEVTDIDVVPMSDDEDAAHDEA
uniref:ERF1_1 domain-containing protein n=1 Tax=Steinernema glaseri TaxID=37863 RepID=A0A1I7Y1K4_9BILA